MENFTLAESEIPTTPREEQGGNFWRFLLDLLETLLISVALFLGINAVTARVRVDGFSMRPTLEDGQYVLVNKMAYRASVPEHGDIIVFHFPIDPEQDFIKRVIGIPGDTVLIKNGEVFVNDIRLDEPYIAAAPRYSAVSHVADNQLFVLGDNRNDSSDSHSWGEVPFKNVVGRAVLVYWPPPSWNFIDHIPIAIAAPQNEGVNHTGFNSRK